MNEPFYMVFVEGKDSPSCKHRSLESAETEAKRLANQTELKTYVLCTVKSFEKKVLHMEDLRPSNSELFTF